MNIFIFEKEKYQKLFDCSMKSYDEWKELGKPNVIIGSIFLTVGTIYEVLYFPLLIVMLKPEFINTSSYKIMFYLGIIDILCVSMNSLLSGYFSIIGANFCYPNPTLMYIVGNTTAALWCTACCTCLLLAFNRCVELSSPYWGKKLFDGRRTWLWLIIPTIYGMYYFFFQNGGYFTSIAYAWFFDPYFGTDIGDKSVYPSMFLAANNILFVACLCSFYLALCVGLVIKIGFKMGKKVSSMQRQTILQSILICSLFLTAASIYVYMQFFPTPEFLVLTAQVTWQASHGGAVFIYLTFNRAMRRAVIRLILPKSWAKFLLGQEKTIAVTNLKNTKITATAFVY